MISPSYFPAIAAVELGCFQAEGLDAKIELVYPVTKAFDLLRDGDVDYVGGAAHAPLYVFSEWQGCRLLCALSQHMYWFLVVRSDLDIDRGDLQALAGLHIGAAPGPVDGLRRMLREVGMDPDESVDIGPVPGSAGAGVSFGVTAAKALEEGLLDGFWANGMGAEVAVRRGLGRVVLDARRGDGPSGAREYTFAALATTEHRIETRPEEVQAAVRAIVSAQAALQADPSLATAAARPHFGEYETDLIADLIERDAPFYDPAITEQTITALNAFAKDLGLLDTADIPFDRVVARGLTEDIL